MQTRERRVALVYSGATLMGIARIDPPERGFYAQQFDSFGTSVKAHADVAEEAVLEAGRRIGHLLGSAPALASNLASAGAEMHVIGRHQNVTDLPMYRHMAGAPFAGEQTMDERARGYGGLHACCSEDSLLNLPTARHKDHRDICSHEMAHTLLRYGFDEALRSLVESRYKTDKPRWRRAYAAKNFHEFFAELTMWYVGSRGDYTSLPSPAPGPDWLASYDPDSFTLLDAIYTGVLQPDAIVWERVQPSGAKSSANADSSVSLLFVNETDRPIERFWLSYKGERRTYGPIASGSVAGQSTYATHPWVLVDDRGNDIGVFVAEKGGHTMVRITDELVSASRS